MAVARSWWANGNFYFVTAWGWYRKLENCEVEIVREHKSRFATNQVRWTWGFWSEQNRRILEGID